MTKPPTLAPTFHALIPCAGVGSRAWVSGSPGENLPKQYQLLSGKPLVKHTLDAFAAITEISSTLVVVAEKDDFFETQLSPSATSSLRIAHCGGATRAHSVFNGLNDLLAHGAQREDWVLVHDAARCLILPAQIQRLMRACQDDAVGGLLALQLPDTLKRAVAGRAVQTVDRSDKWLAQTPQMFRLGVLHDALVHAQDKGFAVTDEASAMEVMGLSPQLVVGSAQNFKVTYPEDFALAEAILRSRQP